VSDEFEPCTLTCVDLVLRDYVDRQRFLRTVCTTGFVNNDPSESHGAPRITARFTKPVVAPNIRC
jgi:hypothetical protein